MTRELLAYQILNSEKSNKELLPSHVSVYMTLLFGSNCLPGVKFALKRKEMMFAARIKSTVTFYNCLNDLHRFGFIEWAPGRSPSQDSYVTVLLNQNAGTQLQISAVLDDSKDALSAELLTSKINLESGGGQQNIYTNSFNSNNLNSKNKNIYTGSESIFDQVDFSKINVIHDVFSIVPPKMEWVVKFFLANGHAASEAEKFFNYNQGKNWVTNNSPIKNWGAFAKNWMSRAKEKVANNFKSKGDYVHVKNNSTKNYAEPL